MNNIVYKKSATFIYPGLPVSVNNAFRQTRNIRYPTPEMRRFKATCAQLVRDGDWKTQYLSVAPWYTAVYTFYFPLLYKNGNPRKLDVSNRIKHLEDKVCPLCRLANDTTLDDKLIKYFTAAKLDSDEQRTVVTIYSGDPYGKL